MTLKEDAQGDIIGYYLNSTVGTMRIYGPAASMGSPPMVGTVNITAGNPVLCCFNFSQALGNAWGWSPSQNTAIDFGLGVMWAKPVPTEINGETISPALAMDCNQPTRRRRSSTNRRIHHYARRRRRNMRLASNSQHG